MNNLSPVGELKRPARRFNDPPVKLACLSCRALRIRCDGQAECANCAAKGRSCCYVPSRRGGPRIHPGRKNKGISLENPIDLTATDKQGPSLRLETPTPMETEENSRSEGEEWVSQLSGLCGPGAGLRNVEVPLAEIDSIFDSIFTPVDKSPKDSQSSSKPNQIRIYDSNEHLQVDTARIGVLSAYYIFIHPYFPILPPPERLPVTSSPISKRPPSFEPINPLGRAIAAIMVLVPHPNEKEPSRPEYVKIRRDFAHCFAKSAFDAVEIEYGTPDAPKIPKGQAAEAVTGSDREPFHPKLPVSLEGVVALALLSVYEYAQQGHLDRMLHRSNQSLALALSMSLHEALDEDEFAEARRRVWWMTYMSACQGLAVSNLPPAFDLYDPWFVTPYPEGWKLLVEAQQAILESATFSRDLDQVIKSGGDASWVLSRMAELDSQIASLLLLCRDSLSVSEMVPPPDSPDFVASKTMRAFAEIKLHTARIKTHRLCAFQDIDTISSEPLDLEAPATDPIDFSLESGNSPIYIQDPPVPPHARRLPFPFTSDESSRICLHAAFNVVVLLNNLPHPSPTDETPESNAPLSLRPQLEIPRTMPTLICCAMQSGYAMLMLCVKARTLRRYGEEQSSRLSVDSLTGFREELHQSLRGVVKCLDNYSIAYEALHGVRDEISQAIEREFRL
ncbi:C6 finger domain protein [Aspergillus steynii IBT 23096]|uniref:C6 finger domain protein n=1 Tax=Aspergillus steynii IBT 23096 TaxID=1392250 RepID=A0A2I2GMU4_9EURO|nr:C6 finger domain protein [Aspergillus steynii IBT 23096]PLB54195.1 C6 finger domain protein [Aspergillus steynii IBT 23096]